MMHWSYYIGGRAASAEAEDTSNGTRGAGTSTIYRISVAGTLRRCPSGRHSCDSGGYTVATIERTGSHGAEPRSGPLHSQRAPRRPLAAGFVDSGYAHSRLSVAGAPCSEETLELESFYLLPRALCLYRSTPCPRQEHFAAAAVRRSVLYRRTATVS